MPLRTRCRRRWWRRCGCGPAPAARPARVAGDGRDPAARRRPSSEASRHRREEATYAEPRPAATEAGDDTLFLLFCCCHSDLAPASQVALTLRAIGGLTTREIPTPSTCRRRRWRSGSAGPSAPGEAIRLARQLTLATDEPEARGLLALMLNHSRLPARFDSEGRIVTLDRQDRGLRDTREIAEGVRASCNWRWLFSAAPRRHPGRGRP
jgi:predicted RNA polymerase sigma factor